MRNSLQSRIIKAILVTFAAVAFFFGIVFLALLSNHTDAMVDKSRMLLKILMEREEMPLANEIFEERLRAVQLRVREILALDNMLSVTVYDRKGEPLAHLDRFGGAPSVFRLTPDASQTRLMNWHGIRSLVFDTPVLAMGDPIGHVRIHYSLAGNERYKRMSLLALAILLFTTLLMMILILNRMMITGVRRPIEGLRSAMKRIETEGPGMVVALDRDDEIGDLTRSFNTMSVQLAELLEQSRVEVMERKKAQEELRLSEEKFSSAFRASPDAISIVDRDDGTVIEVNESFERITGWSRDDAVGQDLRSLGLWEDAGRMETILTDIEGGRETTNLEFTFVKKTGERRVGLISMHPVWLDGTRLLVSLIHDITQRKRSEEALRRSQEMLDSIIRSIPDILYRLDPDGKITFINDAVVRYGYRPAELIGTDIIDLVHPEDRAEVERALKERRSSRRKTRDLTLRLLNKEHRVGVFATRNASIVKPHIMLVDAEGLYEGDTPSLETFRGTQGIARDITRLKDLEERLRQAQKMEAIGTLAGGIAHDFNNILGGIIGYAELALQAMPPEPGRLKTYMERILCSSQRASDLVRQILQFARRGDTTFAPVYLGPVLKETLKLMAATLPKTIVIDVTLPKDPCAVMGDPTQIHQVLMNLCTNAYHAMRELGGTLSVSMDVLQLPGKSKRDTMDIRPGRYVRISVADTGPGIPQEIRERIFEPYFTTKKMNEGTGMGLSVSLGIVQSHGGVIGVESVPGKGTAFTVFLPVTEPKAAAETSAAMQLPKGDGERLLLVDDEPFFLDAMREQLNSLGYAVETHDNGLNALARLMADPTGFDMVITDQTMPEITGVQLAGSVRKLRTDLPILLCTGYSETVTEETASQFGIAKFLMKPISREDLALAVHHALRSADG